MSRFAKCFVLFISLIGFATWGGNAMAAARTSTATGGLWSATTTWVGGVVPASTDSVIIAGPVTVNVQASMTNLTVNAGSTLTIQGGSNFRIRPTGTTTISGTLNFGTTSSSSSFTGLVTVDATGTWNNSGNQAVAFSGGITNNGTFNGGTGTQTFNVTQAIGGTSPINFAGIVAVANNVTLTNNNTNVVTIAGNLTGGNANSTWVNAANSTLNYGGAAGPMGTRVFTASAGGNTVNYTGTAQAVDLPSGSTYANLTLSGSGIKTMPATAMVVLGNFTISGTATATALAALTVGGNWTETGTYTPGTQTVTLNGISAQTISGTSPVAFYKLTVSAANPSITLATNVTVSNMLTGTVTLNSTCPTDYTLTSATPAQTLHSCPPAPPTVTSIVPASGPTAGGTAVTITGTNFTGATAVTIGGASATSIVVSNATTITAITPAGTAGAQNVVVTTPYGTGSGTGLFTYVVAPIVTSISPNTGPTAGGTSVTITGNNFTGATAVTIGGASATSITVSNATTITAVAPAGTAGAQNVVVTTPYGTGTGTGLFTYLAAPIAEYRMDEANWNGTASEVKDNSGSGNHAQAFNSANTADVAGQEAKPGNPGTCRYGVFNGGYVQTPLPNLTTDFTITAWIRTTNNTTAVGQRILIDDEGTTPATGYGFSFNDAGAGVLRFYSRGITSNVILDSTYPIAINTWYFVAAVADITNKMRTIYVFNQSGGLLDTKTETAWTSGTWGTDGGPVSIGGETIASGESALHFVGNLDEVRVYGNVLSQSALTAIATQTHACTPAGPDHYELSLPTSSITCLPTTATVTACADNSSPCTNNYLAASGTTATLTTTAGTMASNTVTFNAFGVAGTTLSYPAAANGTAATATATLSGEQVVAINSRKCCPDGTSCVAANSCSTTFNTTGFIFSGAAGGAQATIPAQVAGTTSGTYYLRAVKTSTTTKACESALSGANTVNFAYECNNPTTCYAANLMSVNGGSATTIARNDNGSVASYTSVNMTFDANGNAPFTFNYSDVGQVKLYASKAASGSLLSALTGLSNAFVAAPASFAFSGITPGLIKAGNPFSVTVTARNALGSTTPNFGKETAPESVTLSSTLVTPNPVTFPAASNPTPGNNVIAGTEFGAGGMVVNDANGVATVNNLNWGEVGSITLTASNSNYLGSGSAAATGTSSTVGAFIPDHFDTKVTPGMACPAGLACPTLILPNDQGFYYSGQPFSVQVTARNLANGTTANYHGVYGLSNTVNLTAWDALGSVITQNPGTGVLANITMASTAFSGGVGLTNTQAYTFAASSTNPTDIFLRAVDSVNTTVTSRLATPANSVEGGVKVVSGRVRLANAYGSELLPLTLTATTQYYNSSGWATSSTDSVTPFVIGAIAPTIVKGPLTVGNLTAGVVVDACAASVFCVGVKKFTLNSAKTTGSANICLSSPAYLQGMPACATGTPGPNAGQATFGVYVGNSVFIYRGRHGR